MNKGVIIITTIITTTTSSSSISDLFNKAVSGLGRFASDERIIN